jgi:tripartite-type tricarboxylate transporter receptor subunit TctC
MHRILLVVGLLCFVAWPPAFADEAYPDRTVSLVAPFAAGGSSDVLARATAQGMGQRLGQAIIVENKAGAGGTLGLAVVARSRPDGYTLGFGGVGSLVYSTGIYTEHPPFNVRQDFVAVGLMGTTPAVFVASRASGITTLADLVAKARQNPGKLTYGTPGVGSALHLAGELFQRLSGIKLVHVPYRGSAPAMTDAMAGQIDLAFVDAASMMGQRSNDALRLLVVAGKERMPQLPGIPTTAEAGYPQLVVQIWYGVVAPRGTPEPVLSRLEAVSQEVAASPNFQKLLDQSGYQPFSGGRGPFKALIEQELDLWLPVIKAANITPQ